MFCIRPENVRLPETIFWHFQGVLKRKIGLKWVNEYFLAVYENN